MNLSEIFMNPVAIQRCGVLHVISEAFYITYAICLRERGNPTSYSALQSSEKGVPAAFNQ